MTDFQILGPAPETITLKPVERKDFKGIVAELEKLQDGKGIEIATHLSHQELATVRQSAIRRGFNVLIRNSPNGFLIYRAALRNSRRSPEQFERYRECAERFAAGETLDAIGQSFGVSRQAIEQRIRNYERFSELPFGHSRIEATDNFILPYLAVVKDMPSCVLCGAPSEKRHTGMCADCRTVIKIRTAIASRLRGFLKYGERHYLSQAIMDIRRYGVKPEDLERA